MSSSATGRTAIGWTAGALAVGLSVFQLYTAGFGTMSAMFQRGIHLSIALAVVFLLWPSGGRRTTRLALAGDVALALAAFAVGGYLLFFYDEIIWRIGDATRWDIALGVVATLLVLEGTRRTTGWIMSFIALVFLAYAFFGNYLPGPLAHKGYSLERVMTQLYLTTEGIYGTPLAVAATYVFIFVLFGAFLEVTGAGQFFIDLAYALTGRYRGGPAKTSVIASAFLGSVSGSAIANTVATGSFTIPLMKKLGYEPHEAGGIEAAASTGGQMMPPIMGAGAFLMAEYTGLPYLQIVKVSILPAILYFYTVLLFVHVWAVKKGLTGSPRHELPAAGATLRAGAHFVLPFGVLLYFLFANYSPMMVGFVSVVSVFLAAFLRRATRVGLRQTLSALETGARNAVGISMACACAGIIVGVVGLTGLGLKFSHLVVNLSGGYILPALVLVLLASLVLGMGLPVTASYIVLIILAGPALQDMGIPLLVAHMVVFWYSQDANVTPPVALAAFAGAGIAGANVMKTSLVSWKLAKGLYLIPVLMVYSPLLLNGPAAEVVFTAIAATLALTGFVAALEGHLLHPVGRLGRVSVVVGGVLIFWPGATTDWLGLGILTAALAPQVVPRLRRSAALS